MLKGLSKNEIVSKLRAFSTSQENQNYSLFFDYYNGDHFVKSGKSTDYSFNTHFDITTRSGRELFDDSSDEERSPVKSNWCRPIIDNIADFTRGTDEEIVVISDDKEDELKKVWKLNNIDIKTHEIAYEAGIYGKTYIRIRRREKTSPIEILNVDPGAIYENRNPLTDDIDSIIYYFSIPKSKAQEMFPNVGISGDGWVFYAEEWFEKEVHKFIDGVQVEGERPLNPYGFIPFVEIKGNIFSNSDIEDVIPLNDELNITLTYINEIIKYHAFPIFSPKGTFSADNILPAESLKDVEISPRALLNFPIERIEGKGVDSSILEHLDSIRKDIAVVSGVPVKLLMAEVDGSTSGVALERMMSTIVKQAEVRRNYIRDAYKKINRMILTLLGGKADAETDIIFPNILKVDQSERLDEAIKKQTLGISKETIFEELGYDYQEEEGQRKEEFDNSLDQRILNESLSVNNKQINAKEKINGGTQKKNI